MKKIILLISILLLCSCKIEQVYEFNKDGSGNYSVGVDMSEMMKMSPSNGSKSSNTKNIDTLFSFAKIIETEKDSISKLSSEDRAKLMALKPLSMRIQMDTSSTNPKAIFKVLYKFKKFEELKNLSKIIEGQNLDALLSGKQTSAKSKKESKIGEMLSMMEGFDSKLTSKEFTFNINEKGLEKVNAKNGKKANGNTSPYAEMMKFKQVFRFPYKIKSVNNKNYKISSDLKSIELELNMDDAESEPKSFDVEVKFK